MNAVITNDSAALTASTGSRQQAPRNLAPAVCAITTDNTFFLRGSSHVIPQVRVLRPVGLQPLSRDGSVSVAVLSALAGDERVEVERGGFTAVFAVGEGVAQYAQTRFVDCRPRRQGLAH
jgi:hypothetical protein